jgi:hypothetical protein
MKMLVAAFIIILTCSSYAQTSFSKTIKDIQQRYASKYTKLPILIFDQDEIEFLYAKADVFDMTPENEIERSKILQQYVLDNIGVSLSINQARSIEVYTTALKASAAGVPVPDYSTLNKYSMCAVFPASPNSNKRLETERILGLGIKGAYLDRHYSEIKDKLSYDELRFYSLFHELSHCLDGTYIPQALLYNDGHSFHMAESYAEVMGLMLLEKEGLLGTATKRAHYRNLYSSEMGKWFAQADPIFSMGPLFKEGGAIYYLTPSLLGAELFLGDNKSFVKEASIEELLSKTSEIVETHALKGRVFSSIVSWFKDGDKATQKYVKLSYKYPDLFTDTLDRLLGYQVRSKYMMEQTWNIGFRVVPVDFNLSIDDVNLCRFFDASDKAGIELEIDKLRKILRESDEFARIDDLKKAQTSLNNLYPRLSKACSNVQ